MIFLWLGYFLICQEILVLKNQVNANDNNGSFRKKSLDGKMKFGGQTKILTNYEYMRYIRILLKEKEEKIQSLLKQDKEDEVYRTFLASRIQSSIVRDFLTMRY